MNSNGHKVFVGSGGDTSASAYLPFDGYIAEYVFIDGTQYDSTDLRASWVGEVGGLNNYGLNYESEADVFWPQVAILMKQYDERSIKHMAN